MPTLSNILAFAALTTLVASAPPAFARPIDSPQGFEEIYRDDDIVVSARDNATGLPTFRGEGIIDTSILQILAVFKDSKQHTKWMHACKTSRIVKRVSELEAFVYNRTNAPWPVADRDLVVHAKLEYDFKAKEAWNVFKAVKQDLVPEVDGVVRMPRLEGFYRLVSISPEKTLVVYQVDADPGGSLPGWLAKLASRALPYRTIFNLRKQAMATRGKYDDVIIGWIKKYNIPVPPEAAAKLQLSGP